MEILINNGLIYDGSGSPPFYGNIRITDEMITAVEAYRGDEQEIAGSAASDPAVRVVDASGKMVTPGFIDIHRHCDLMPFTNPEFGRIELAQGITTTFVGNCGLTPVPTVPRWRKELYDYLEPVTGRMPEGLEFEDFKSYAQALEAAELPINMGFMAGSDSIKVAVKGFGNRPYTAAELDQARARVREALDQGAFGLSLGIMYQPECYSSRDELVAVVRAAAVPGAVLCTHIRGEGDSLADSVAEVIGIAAEAGIPLNISHFKATGLRNWNRNIYQAMELIEAARAAGQDVTADFYPYDGGATTLQSLLPPTVMKESMAELLANLAAPEGRQTLREELGKVHEGWDNMAESIGWERILISSVAAPDHAHMPGRTIQELADEGGYEDAPDLIADLLVKEEGKVGIIVLSMSQADVDTVARLPYTMLISDALYGGDSRHAHPRLLGSTARFLRDYVRERQVMPMAEAIKKMTGMPAARMGLADRGLIKAGCRADILVFDPEKFRDHAGYTGTNDLCTGMDAVLLGGTEVFRDGVVVDRTAGRLLKRRTY